MHLGITGVLFIATYTPVSYVKDDYLYIYIYKEFLRFLNLKPIEDLQVCPVESSFEYL